MGGFMSKEMSKVIICNTILEVITNNNYKN